MTAGKWIGILVGGSVAVLIGLASLGAWLGAWPALGQALWFTLPFAVICGGVVGTATWAMVGRVIDQDLEKLHSHIASYAHAELATVHYRPRAWLRCLAETMDKTLSTLRQRIEQLQGERRELEIQLRVIEAEREHTEAILHSISDAVLVTDAFNEIALANHSAAEALAFDLNGAVHQPLDRVVQDNHLAKMIRDTREGGNPANRRHLEHRIDSGRRSHIYDVSLSCMTNQQDEVSGVVTILRDVTKEKEISEMKNDFVSSVSHELRTPLSSIKAYVEMLVDGEAQDEETRTEFYNIIQGESERLGRLIDNILNISRIESGVIKLQRENIALPTVVREAVDVMQPQAQTKQIKLAFKETPLFFQVYADKDMIYQATLNLVSNAIKYTPEGGKVTVDSEVDEHQHTVTVHVTDTGVGIPDDALPHLFEKFYRVSGHKKMAKGTGLGLNLVRHIIETVHGGKVSVTSEAGKGSTFSYTLPISDGSTG